MFIVTQYQVSASRPSGPLVCHTQAIILNSTVD